MGDRETNDALRNRLLADPARLRARIEEVLSRKCGCESLYENEPCERVRSSSVMLLLGEHANSNGHAPEVCFILNKRSMNVRQGGDLCCPGGTANSRLDPVIAWLLTLPGSPLTRWAHWRELRKSCPEEARLLSQLLATGLRESWEEMRLYPFLVRFLGPLPSQCLLLFRRVIHPMVAWVSWQKHFLPSWEVERIVTIPVRELLHADRYVRYRLDVPPQMQWRFNGKPDDFPCFRFVQGEREELLWGVTFRIVTLILELVFDFAIPPCQPSLWLRARLTKATCLVPPPAMARQPEVAAGPNAFELETSGLSHCVLTRGTSPVTVQRHRVRRLSGYQRSCHESGR